MTTLHIEQRHLHDHTYAITLRLSRDKQAELTARAEIEFALAEQE